MPQKQGFFQTSTPTRQKPIISGSEERLSPILMTATTTALALLPIALGGSRPGHEIEYPMAVIIIGGLFTSTVLNLVLMPVLYERFGGRSGKDRSNETNRKSAPVSVG